MQKIFGSIFVAWIVAFASGGGPVFATPAGQPAPLNDLSKLNITSTGSSVARTAGARTADEINGMARAEAEDALYSGPDENIIDGVIE